MQSSFPEMAELLTLAQVADCATPLSGPYGAGRWPDFPAPAENRQGYGSIFSSRL